jgi:hypothetical protein
LKSCYHLSITQYPSLFFYIVIIIIIRILTFATAQGIFDVRLDLDGLNIRSISFDGHSILVNQEFGEVPFDCINDGPVLFMLEELPQRMGIASVHIDFGVKIGIEVELPVDKLLDLLICPRLLVIELF